MTVIELHSRCMDSEETSAADTAQAEPATTILPPTVPTVDALAWSQSDTEEVVPYTHRRSYWVWVALVLVLLAVSGAGVAFLHRPAPPSAHPAQPSRVQPAPVRGPIDGTYRVDHYRGQAIIRTPSGEVSAAGPATNTVATEWWALRSKCNPACTAIGTRLDDDTHQYAATNALPDMPAGEARQSLLLIDGQWQTDHPNKVQQDCISNTGSDTWRWSLNLTKLPDGSLKGEETDVVETNECHSVGNVVTTPVVATRVGEVPPGLPPLKAKNA